MQHTTMDQINYNGLPDDDDDIKTAATQLACGMLKLDDYQPIRELERIRSESNQALETTQFSTSREKELAETVQRNTNGWIDTAKDALCIAVNITGLVNTCAPIIATSGLMPDDVVRAIEHAKQIETSVKRIYNRSCDMSVSNSMELLSAIKSSSENTNAQVNAIAEQHRDDVRRFQNGEVNINVPYQSHRALVESVYQSNLRDDPNVREKAKKSSWSWDTAFHLATVAVAVCIIVSLVVLKSKR